jgi:hypothetical protein
MRMNSSGDSDGRRFHWSRPRPSQKVPSFDLSIAANKHSSSQEYLSMPNTSPARRLQIALDEDRWQRLADSCGAEHDAEDKLVQVRQTWKKRILSTFSLGLVTAHQQLSPNGAGVCDHNPLERCANCMTSVPYSLIGLHTIRNRKSLYGKAWGYSLVGVGAASALFHSSSGPIRPTCRKIDFWTISGASNLMLRAIYPNVPPALTALGFVATPFRPFLVSFINTSLMEAKYIDRARKNPKLRKSWGIHAVSTLIGLSCFALEDLRPDIPLMHASWHCLSSVVVATINNLAADEEEMSSRRGGEGELSTLSHLSPAL